MSQWFVTRSALGLGLALIAATSSCNERPTGPSGEVCERALQRSAGLVVDGAAPKSGFADADEHRQNLAAATRERFMARCHALEAEQRDALASCIDQAETEQAARRCWQP